MFEESPGPSGCVALDAADGFSLGFALADASGDVVLGSLVVAGSGDGDEVERPVELAVAAPVESEPVAGLA